MTLRASGAPARLRRAVGTSGAASGLRGGFSAARGARLSTTLPTTFRIRAGGGAARFSIVQALTNFFVKVAGSWKQATAYIKIGGVWKQASPKINISGTWK